MLSYLRDDSSRPYSDDEKVAFEIFGHGVVFMGSWKAVRLRSPWDDHTWRLYDLRADPGEEQDLAGQEPDLLAGLVKAYDDFAAAHGVIDEPEGVTAYPHKPSHLGDLIVEE